MGPRFFKRGELLPTKSIGGPNGASMGPRFFKRGEYNCPSRKWRRRDLLQWGHASSSVERRAFRCLSVSVLMASMGPRFFKRGEIEEHKEASRAGQASMGPRFFKRGEIVYQRDLWVDFAASMGPRFFKRGESWAET